LDRTVTLDAETQRAVNELVADTAYGSPDEVIRIAVARERSRHARKARIRALQRAEFKRLEPLIREGLADVEADRVVDLDEACTRLTAKYEKMAADRGH